MRFKQEFRRLSSQFNEGEPGYYYTAIGTIPLSVCLSLCLKVVPSCS